MIRVVECPVVGKKHKPDEKSWAQASCRTLRRARSARKSNAADRADILPKKCLFQREIAAENPACRRKGIGARVLRRRGRGSDGTNLSVRKLEDSVGRPPLFCPPAKAARRLQLMQTCDGGA